MPLSIHLLIHFLVAIIIAGLLGMYFKKIPLAIIAGIMGGFFIDLDHVLEYFLYYGLRFNLNYFIEGREFLFSDKIYLLFHAWEYVPILLIFAYIIKKRRSLAIFIFVFVMAGAAHLFSDVIINQYPLKFYSLSYRASKNFSAPHILSPENYQKNLKAKENLKI